MIAREEGYIALYMRGGTESPEKKMRVHGARDFLCLFWESRKRVLILALGLRIRVCVIFRYVLPNHQLFLLAEQPPSDMAGLLGLFQHVPAVIRRRAKELLDTIREAAKDVVAVEAVTAEVSAPSESVRDEAMTVVEDEVKENIPQDAPSVHEQQLWPSGD